MRPPSKRSSRSWTIVPSSESGLVERTWPSARSRSGVAKTSSVGRFGTKLWPKVVFASAACQLESGSRPTVRSVPGPRKWIESKRRRLRISARFESLAMCSRQAPIGSGSSSLTVCSIARQRRSTSGSPKIALAQPSVGAPIRVQATWSSTCCWSEASSSSRCRDPATRAGSRSERRPGSGSPEKLIFAASRRSRTRGDRQATAATRRASPRARSRSASGARADRRS